MAQVFVHRNKFVDHESLLCAHKLAPPRLKTDKIVTVLINKHRCSTPVIITASFGAFVHVFDVRKSKEFSSLPPTSYIHILLFISDITMPS